MKRIRLLVLAGALAVALPFGMTSVGATGGSGTGTSVSIKDRADYDFVGEAIDVGLNVRCQGGSGIVDVVLEQFPPETPYPVSEGSGGQLVVCDGKTHSVGLTVAGFGFDAGRAKAKATLVSEATTLTPKTTKTERWLTIVVV